MENHSIQFGSIVVNFSVEYRKRKSLAITVYPEGLVIVTAPLGATIEKIKEKVHRRAAWILKQQDIFQQYEPQNTPRKYVSGETHYYMGRQYRLKIIEEPRQKVVFRAGYIEIFVPNKNDKKTIQKMLELWYRDKAKEKFEPIFRKCLEKLPLNIGRKAQLTYKVMAMPKRWGSCTKSGNILLNPNLIKTPKSCIEYVILHELCHLIVPYHNVLFYELQSRLIPDWRDLKKKLEFYR